MSNSTTKALTAKPNAPTTKSRKGRKTRNPALNNGSFEMKERHQSALTERLERVLNGGHAHILDAELRLWYAARRISFNAYRDLDARWKVISQGKQGELWHVPGSGGFYLFADKDAKKMSEKAKHD